ncbi:phosphate acyltransferase PlsX [Psychromonas sp. psych-6C06]|uniref:phosphate acyltransferase PlsX n=1 Tax=Psychromonas sp. psych-6C06 TaxID=2058089 RepID=UPI000C31B967|nr:phosphate acyltransferase PlsX [Psychromonas sp. psych-6C06]PKF62608.1 phosphate acyltransferase PlsX [Psychromonas sp. psych-6C06]
MRNYIIALDAMGGDLGPHISLLAAKQKLQQYPTLSLIIVGTREKIIPLLKLHNLIDHSRLSFVHADNVISMEDNPVYVLRHVSHSSMHVALQMVADGKADACVSAGNTGALMLLAKQALKTISSVSRPALVSGLPNNCSGLTYLLDLGANLQCDSDTLFNFAVMGSVLCEKVEQIEKPKVALLNVGKENNKGSDIIKRSATLLSESKYINYVGFIEANELFSCQADVVVTDGFSGNIALKSYEGMGRVFLEQLEKAVNSNFYSKLLGKLLSPILKKQFKHLHPDMYNGASLIGLRGIVVKSHGGANEIAFSYAIEQAIKEIQWQIPNSISNRLEAVLLERDCLSHE